MREYYAKAVCGCCEVGPMRFESEESALEAFRKVGFTSNGTIVDDAGEEHERVDTFYGFWEEDSEEQKEANESPLAYLARRAFGE